MENAELLGACRSGITADSLLEAALKRGAAIDEYADTGDLDHEGDATHLARIYTRRVKHLSREGLLLVDEVATLADLDDFAATQQPARVIVRTEREGSERIVYTALLAGRPPRIRACLVHRLPDR